MAKSNDKLDWTEIDTTAFRGELKSDYDALRKLRAEAAVLRRSIEERLAKALADAGGIPAGMEPVFSPSFGKLSVAFRPIVTKRAKHQPMVIKV